MKSYCLTCNKEADLNIDKIVTLKYYYKFHGRCKKCNSYCCRIIYKTDKYIKTI